MPTRLNEAQLGVLVGQKNYRALRDALADANEVDVAQFISDLPEQQALLVFRTLNKDHAMDVFAELEPDMQQHIVRSISDEQLGSLMDDLAVDDAVDMLEEMPAALVKRVLRTTTPETRKLLNQFLRYPDNSAGSIMTAEFMDLRADMTVEDAIKRIRRTGDESETIYTCYVIDDARFLQGVVTVKDLLLAHDTALVADLMEPYVVSVTTATDKEEVARRIAAYGLYALPVVDGEGRLVGIVTVDDAVDVIQEEATEDFEKMAGMAPSEKPYLKTSVLRLARNRLLWLMVLMVGGLVTAGIMTNYELAFSSIPLLVTFIPMLTDTGGDAGSQASTLVIRGMALNEIRVRDFLPVVWKEVRVSLLMGVPLAVINFVRVVLVHRGDPLAVGVAVTISLAMLFTLVLANAVGASLPMLAKLLHIDPAVMAAPLISTLVDGISLVIYFTLAFMILPV